jgi:uncharacterized protein (TIGR01777 family)
VRSPPQEEESVFWDFESFIDSKFLRDFQVVIHLAGENLSTGKWTQERKERIRASRITSTEALSNSIARANAKPTFLCASAVGFYGNQGDSTLTESHPHGTGFLAELCCDWERATTAAEDAGARVIHLRMGVVLSAEGGALKKVQIPFRWGLGGPLGDGTQWMSWIALNDLVRVIDHIIQRPSLSGPLNIVSPYPVTNNEFSQTLARILRKPLGPRIPKALLRFVLGEIANELLLASTRAVPERLLRHEFQFHFARLDDTLRHLLKK